ncbi:MAG: hypothetical protein K2J48_05235 [Muribaculaceae bacterium]|nr:hypothetical protein [Muribaculaceae bacterium]MDE6792468.1 hypothetical protein [Muribaculaceae bacterium]
MKLLQTCRLGGFALAAIFYAAILSSCSDPSFKIKGNIEGADNQSVVLEKSDFHGRWIAIDSTRTNSSGDFSISRPAPAGPEIFRLSINDKYVYVPIDSIETVSLSSSLDKFGTDFSLSGSENASALERFEKEVRSLPANISADSLQAFKKSVFTKYIQPARGSIVAYYALTKIVDGKPLFDPTTSDYKYFAAVATGFKETRPNDPHTALLEQTSLDALKRKKQEQGIHREIQAEELAMIDINLPDEKGKNIKLSEVMANGKKTVLIFSLLTHPDSPALNLDLSNLYKSMGGNVNFYHVALDADQYAWRDAAVNLPWTTVFDPEGAYSKNASNYNVGNLPAYFIYSASGELIDRAFSVDDLKKKL